LFLGDSSSPFNELDRIGDVIAMLRAIGVRYVVMHPEDFENSDVERALTATLATDRRQVVTERRFTRIVVYTLAPGDPAPVTPTLRRVPATAIRATASHSPDRLPMLFDGILDTRWLSGGRQTGDEWIELRFDRDRDIGLVRLQMAERSFGDYPRELVVETFGNVPGPLFRGSVLTPFSRGLLTSSYPNIDVLLPVNRADGIRLRQVGSTRRFFWSIHELEVWER
jgi:hypothetical protein